MSTMDPPQRTEQDIPAAGASPHSQRVLACELCKQRKVRCDRKFPCSNCTRAGVQCVPATALARRQRRRKFVFPEQDLLERLRYYEGLLRKNNISFDPLFHLTASPSEASRSPTDHHQSEFMSDETLVTPREATDLWHAISQVTLDSEDDGEDEEDDSNVETLASSTHPNESLLMRYGVAVTKAMTSPSSPRPPAQHEVGERMHDYLLFVQPSTDVNIDLSGAHPEQVQIFRLWQIYLDNVNPLFKVTHTPSLQPRIIDAVSNLMSISPTLEALLFSIYCMAVVSLDDDECWTFFQSSRKSLLARYQFACRQALLKCHIWETTDIDALTAFYLYLIPVSSEKDVPYLSCSLAAAFRIAQRMGIHSEARNAKCSVLEAEMRRRLWWSLVTFDYRVCELLDYKSTTLVPTWDCKIPLNVNDFELRQDMSHPPSTYEKPTEAVFAVVRSGLADHVRYSPFHLNFVNPALNAIARAKDPRHGPVAEGEELSVAERLIDDEYLSFCDPEDRLHYMTIWTTRNSIARSRLLAHYQRQSSSVTPESEEQRNAAASYAIAMLKSDTKLRTSPLTKGFLWFISFYLPALGSLYILNDLRKWPDSSHAEEAWRAVADNYEAVTLHSSRPGRGDQRCIYLDKFSQLVLRAWEARGASLRGQGKLVEPPPRIVLDVEARIRETYPALVLGCRSGEQLPSNDTGINGIDDSHMPSGPIYNENKGSTEQVPTVYPPDLLGQGVTDIDMEQIWTGIDWTGLQSQG